MIDMLKSMAIFSKVAHLGSFRAAAQSEGVSPSVISRHISILEDNLGEVLLSRSTRKLALTSIGEEFLVHCDRMLQAANEGLTSINDNVNQGHLRVTLPITLITKNFGKIIQTFRVNNPLVDFSFIFDDGNIDIVGKGVDVALRLGPLKDSSLRAKRIGTIKRSVICTPEYLASIGDVLEPADLNQCYWIGRKNPSILPVMFSSSGEMYTVPEQSRFIQVNNVEAVKAFVTSHNGVGLFSNMLVEQELENGSVVQLLPEWRVESMAMYAVWSAQKTTGQLVKRFVDFLSEELSEV